MATPAHEYGPVDGIFRTIDFHRYVYLKKHSAVSGPGVKYDPTMVSDYETNWECKSCHLPPPIDINILLGRQRKAWLNENRRT